MKDQPSLMFETISIKGNTGYASAYDKNGLYRVNMSTGESVFLRNFDEQFTLKRMHSSVVRIQDKLFFIPASGEKISVYDIKYDNLESVEIPAATREDFPFYNKRFKFIDAIQYNKDLWLIPSSYPGIVRLDLTSYDIDVYDSWIPQDGFFFRSKPVIEGHNILIPNGNSNLLLKFDLKTQKASFIYLGDNNKGVMCMMKMGAKYYFAPRLSGPIISWNPSNDSLMEFDVYPELFDPGEVVFSYMFDRDGKLFFVPAKANMGVVLENDTIKEDSENHWKTQQGTLIEYLFETTTECYFREIIPKKDCRYFKIRKSNGEKTEYDFYIINHDEERSMSIKSVREAGEVLYESRNLGIEELLKNLD